MRFTQEQLSNIAQKSKVKLVQSVPELPIGSFDIECTQNDIYSFVITFKETGVKLGWCGDYLSLVIEADYDVLWLFEDIGMDMIGVDDPKATLNVLAGINTINLRAENAKLREEIAELRLRPGGPDYEMCKSHFENMVDAKKE